MTDATTRDPVYTYKVTWRWKDAEAPQPAIPDEIRATDVPHAVENLLRQLGREYAEVR